MNIRRYVYAYSLKLVVHYSYYLQKTGTASLPVCVLSCSRAQSPAKIWAGDVPMEARDFHRQAELVRRVGLRRSPKVKAQGFWGLGGLQGLE